MKKLRKMAVRLLAVLAVLLLLFFLFVPRYIDRSKNRSTAKGPFERVAWYDSLPFIADLHCDALLWDRRLDRPHDYGHVDLPRMQEANMAFQVFTVVSKVPAGINIEANDEHSDQIGWLHFAQLRPPGWWWSVQERALGQCAALRRLAEDDDNQFRLITSRQQLQQFVADRSTRPSLMAGMLGLEGAHCLEGGLASLDLFYQAGVRYIGLTHFFDNEWAGSAHGIKKAGLTAKGRQLLKRMEQLGIMVDLAHASPATIDDVLTSFKGGILVSHTGVQGVCNNRRNLSDRHLDMIGKRGGLVGIGLWETAVCGKDAAATARSIRYVANRIGVDKVALGSDWDGAFEMHFDVTGAPLLVAALVKEGFSRAEISRIMGENIRDFMLRHLPAKADAVR